ncbi:hypothetical protein [Rhizobium leguminosarum]
MECGTGMVRGLIPILLSLSGSLVATAHADSVKRDSYRVRYALFLESGQKILSETTCKLRENCVVYGASGGDMQITINLGNENTNRDDIRIHCISYNCVFGEDKPILRQQGETHFRIYRGERANGLEMRNRPLVGDLIVKHDWIDPRTSPVNEKI